MRYYNSCAQTKITLIFSLCVELTNIFGSIKTVLFCIPTKKKNDECILGLSFPV